MGLFEFIQDAGKKIGLVGDGPGKEVDELQVDVRGREITVDNGVVAVSGTVNNQADREKIILALGNLAGVSQVDESLEVMNPESEAFFYTVQSGDTLGKIAKEQYGDARKYMKIFEANQPMLKNPDLIYPGQMLRIP
ncbi:MAG: peptidoglycan-binding protein LysM [bacterium]|nr:peptidoglycan-binding protein LysM [bacterium]